MGAVVSHLSFAELVAVTNAIEAVAFLLGAERLFERVPTIEIAEVSVGEKGTQGTGTQGQGTGTEGMALTVSVIVKDGEDAVQCAAEKVKEMSEAVSDLGDWANGGRDGARPSQPPIDIRGVGCEIYRITGQNMVNSLPP